MTNFDGELFIHGDDCIEFVGKIDENKVHVDGDRILEGFAEALEKVWNKLTDEEKQEVKNRIFSEEPIVMGGD